MNTQTQAKTITVDRITLQQLAQLLGDARQGLWEVKWDNAGPVLNPLDEALGQLDELLKDGE